MLLSVKSVKLLNLKILTRDLGYHKEVGVVQMWSNMYRDHGEFILTLLERDRNQGSKEMDGYPLTSPPPSKVQRHDA
jgi:hypothetical protein